MADEFVKPLPVTPIVDKVPALTIDAAAHLSAIIRYSVKARSISPSWAAPVDIAVGQFVQWLTNNADLLHESRALRQKSLLKPAPDSPGKLDAPTDPVIVIDASLTAGAEKKEVPKKEDSFRRLWLALQTPTHGIDHLLLTVSAPPAAVTAQDLSFHVIPASQGCVFEPSLFHLPFFEDADGTTRGEGGSIVCGLNGTFIAVLLVR